MPIFEYTCRNCRTDFELIVQPSTVPACPECNGRELTKHLSVFAVGTEGTAKSAGLPGACGTCGDPRGPGACALN